MDAYPLTFDVMPPEGPRNRLTSAFRIILAIPHLLIGWFAILFTGRYPEGLWDFGVGVQRWSLRLQAYLLLLRDEYPPFSLSA